MTKILVLLLLLGSPAVSAGEFRHYNEWTNIEKAEFATFVGITYIDYKQTVWSLKQKDERGLRLYRESNPLYGSSYPDRAEMIIGQTLGAVAFYYVIGSSTSPIIRRSILGLKFGVVVQNNNIGAKLYKVF